MNWSELSQEDKLKILEQLSDSIKLDKASIDKDWWVTEVGFHQMQKKYSADFISIIIYRNN